MNGMDDPVPPAHRAVILPVSADAGAQGMAVTTACGRNWKQLLALTVGGEAGFFKPLTRGIGAAVRAGASASEIEGFIAALLVKRADPGRIRQYGSTWVRRTIGSFRTRDAAARAAALDNFSKEP
jgi:hypothetical protein